MPPFISFEGLDGSGKTTQIKLLERHLRSKGIPVTLAREPGGTSIGDAIRQILLQSKTTGLQPISELLLYYASRRQNLHQTVLPALAAGQWVLCDRYADASMAYQGYGRGVPLQLLEALNDYVIGRHWPDLTILIDIDPDIGLSRALQRNQSSRLDEGRFESEPVEFFTRVRRGYLTIAEQHKERVRVINGNQAVEAVHDQVLASMTHLLT